MLAARGGSSWDRNLSAGANSTIGSAKLRKRFQRAAEEKRKKYISGRKMKGRWGFRRKKFYLYAITGVTVFFFLWGLPRGSPGYVFFW